MRPVFRPIVSITVSKKIIYTNISYPAPDTAYSTANSSAYSTESNESNEDTLLKYIKEAERNNLINFTMDELAEARRKREA